LNTQWESLANEHILGIEPYEPGKPIEELERELGIHDAIKLASNENPLPPSARVQKAIEAAIPQLNRYPDASGFYLRQALAKKHGVTAEQIVIGSGSNELIELVVHTFVKPGDEAIVPHPSYVVYPMVVQAAGGIRVMVMLKDYRLDLEAMARAVTPTTKLVFVANPNNPTGTWIEREPLQRFVESTPEQTLVVIDEAYIEYVQDPHFPDASRWLDAHPNLIVTRTFSKAYGLAGLRVGYALSHPRVADMLNRVRQAFNVNSIALAAARAAIDDAEHLKRSVELNRAGMAQLQAGLAALGVRYLPSRGNFILIDCARPAAPVYEAMLRQGVIVRPVGNYQLPNHLRLTIGTEAQNQRMLSALEHALKT
jgi:histidinol-phosphate aminotransferase